MLCFYRDFIIYIKNTKENFSYGNFIVNYKSYEKLLKKIHIYRRITAAPSDKVTATLDVNRVLSLAVPANISAFFRRRS
jgi:hypothetical protein